MQVCARKLRVYLSRIDREHRQAIRTSIFEKYVPYIARFATRLSGKKTIPSTDFVVGGGEAKTEDQKVNSGVK